MRAVFFLPAVAALALPVTAAVRGFTGDVLSALVLELIVAVSVSAVIARSSRPTSHPHTKR